MQTVCICGGGSLGTVCAGVFGESYRINLLTQRPECWNPRIQVFDAQQNCFECTFNCISSNPADCIADADIVLLCLPGYLIEDKLRQIAPFLKADAKVGSIVSSTGFFFFAHDILPQGSRLFGFQRVPFIARVLEYGHSANILGYKKELKIVIENDPHAQSFASELSRIFRAPVQLLDSFYEVSFSNSNPILHTSRLYNLFSGWDGGIFAGNPLFYEDWTDADSRLILQMDSEFMELVGALPIKKGSIPALKDYYEVADAEGFTAKIRSITAFKGIKSPMKEVDGGYIPDKGSRYFTEDFAFGLRWIVEYCDKYGIPAPSLHHVYDWGCKFVKSV